MANITKELTKEEEKIISAALRLPYCLIAKYISVLRTALIPYLNVKR